MVVALAMVAEFGAMSLTPSPAHAQADDPEDICMASPGSFIPDQGVALGDSELYNVGPCFGVANATIAATGSCLATQVSYRWQWSLMTAIKTLVT